MTTTVHQLETFVADCEVQVTFDYCPADPAIADCPRVPASVELLSVVDCEDRDVLGELDAEERAELERECLGEVTRWR